MLESLAALDGIKLNFSANNVMVINIALALMMFGVALDTKLEHFRTLLNQPKGFAIGILCQLVLLPVLTFGLIYVLNAHITAGVALGMILIVACPGGNISNFITSLSKGNVALAVSLTAFSTLLAVVTTPFNFAFWGGLYNQTNPLLRPLNIEWTEMAKSVIVILGLPMVVGVLVAIYRPRIAQLLIKPMRLGSLIFFFGLVLGAFYSNFSIFINHIGYIFLIVLLQNTLALAMGYVVGRLAKLSESDSRTISIESSIHNTGLGLALLFNPTIFPADLPLGGMTIIAAWWGIWHIVSGVLLALWWRRK